MRSLGPPISVKVVGRVFASGGDSELSGANIDIFVTPAFVQQYQASTISAEVGMVALKNGQADIPAFEEAFFGDLSERQHYLLAR